MKLITIFLVVFLYSCPVEPIPPYVNSYPPISMSKSLEEIDFHTELIQMPSLTIPGGQRYIETGTTHPKFKFYDLPVSDANTISLTLKVGAQDTSKGYVLVSSKIDGNITQIATSEDRHSHDESFMHSATADLSSFDTHRHDELFELEDPLTGEANDPDEKSDGISILRTTTSSTYDAATIFGNYKIRDKNDSNAVPSTRKLKPKAWIFETGQQSFDEVDIKLYGTKEKSIGGKDVRIAVWVDDRALTDAKKDIIQANIAQLLKDLLEDDATTGESLYKKYYSLTNTHYWGTIDNGDNVGTKVVHEDAILHICFFDFHANTGTKGYVYNFFGLDTSLLTEESKKLVETEPAPAMFLDYDRFVTENVTENRYKILGEYLSVLHELHHLTTFYKKLYKPLTANRSNFSVLNKSLGRWFNELMSISIEVALLKHISAKVDASSSSYTLTDRETQYYDYSGRLADLMRYLYTGDSLFATDFPIGSYSIARAFAMYLIHNYGLQVINTITTSNATNSYAIEDAIKKSAAYGFFSFSNSNIVPSTINDIYQDFALSLLTSFIPMPMNTNNSATYNLGPYKLFVGDGRIHADANELFFPINGAELFVSEFTNYTYNTTFPILSYNFVTGSSAMQKYDATNITTNSISGTWNWYTTTSTLKLAEKSTYNWMGGGLHGPFLTYPQYNTNNSIAFSYLGGQVYPTTPPPTENKDTGALSVRDGELYITVTYPAGSRNTLVEVHW